MVVKSKPKQERKVRDMLNKHFAYIDKKAGKDDQIDENLQMLLGEKDYSPVVLFSISTIIQNQ
jgi:V-type H+-transporting ATPase subunit C